MKQVFLLVLLFMSASSLSAQNCKTKITSSSTKLLLSKQVINVNIMNIHTQAFDRIDYTVTSYDEYGSKMGSEEFYWKSGIVTPPIKNGSTLYDVHTSEYKGAKTIKVSVDKVHYVNDTTCGG